MPVTELETNYILDDLLGPTEKLIPKSPFIIQTITNPENSLSPITGLPNLAKEARILKEVQYALELKRKWYEALDTPISEQPAGPLCFEPWLERAKFERILETPNLDPEQKENLIQAFKEETDVQLDTSLKERYCSEQNTTTFVIQDHKLRSALLPNEDFEDVMLRGLIKARESNSKELVREEKEVEGFLNLQQIVCDENTPIGTRIISCSPPSANKDTPYTKRFVDIWEVKQDEQGKRFAEVTRFTTVLDYEGYRQALVKLDPNYFDEEDENSQFDAYVLSHHVLLPPDEQIGTAEELYEAFFERDYQASKDSLLQEVLQFSRSYKSVVIERLCQPVANWIEIAESFNALVNVSDYFLEKKEKADYQTECIYFASSDLNPSSWEIAYWGRQQVETRAAGCGASSGFKIKSGFDNISEAFTNSVAKKGLENITGICEKCSKNSSDGHYHCPKCNEEYEDETDKSPDQRTKKCREEDCKYVFGCG